MSNKQTPLVEFASLSSEKYSLLEIYNSYHWLITRVEPYKERVLWDDIPCNVPRCFDDPIKEMGLRWAYLSVEWKEPFIESTTPGEYLLNLPYVNVLFRWCLTYKVDGKEITPLHTRDGIPIVSTIEIRKIWGELGIKNKDKYTFRELKKIAMTIESYLFSEHQENLKKLIQAEKVAEPGKEGIGDMRIITGDINKSNVIFQGAGTNVIQEPTLPSKPETKSFWKIIMIISSIIGMPASIAFIIDVITNKIGFVRFIIDFFKSIV